MSLFVAGMSGCKPAASPVVQHKRVQLDALLPFHPLWAQVVGLDRTTTNLLQRGAVSGTVGSALSPLPPTLEIPPAVPATVAEARGSRSRGYENEYLRQLAETLKMQDDIYLARLERLQDKDAEARYLKELADRVASIRVERLRQAEVLDRQITRLRFRDVPLQVQLKVYTDQAAKDAQTQHDLLTAQIDKLTRDAETLVSASIISDLAVNDLKGRREALLLDARKQLDERSRQLAHEREAHLQKEAGRLTYISEPVPSISRIELPDPGPEQAPLALSPLQMEQSAMVAADVTVESSRVQQTAIWRMERDALVQAIRGDTEQAIRQIATKQGWDVEFGNVHDARVLPDVTEEMKVLLRSQWQQPR